MHSKFTAANFVKSIFDARAVFDSFLEQDFHEKARNNV